MFFCSTGMAVIFENDGNVLAFSIKAVRVEIISLMNIFQYVLDHSFSFLVRFSIDEKILLVMTCI